MSHSIGLSSELAAYLSSVNPPEHPELIRCRIETANSFPEHAWFQISPEQAAFMQFLLRVTRARVVLEIGTFTGYSALAFALTLREMHGENSRVVTCDLSQPWTDAAKSYWRAANVSHLIDLRLGPAMATLNDIIAKEGAGTFDFAFIDADKANTRQYYDRAIDLLTQGGLLLVDNVLWAGAVADSGVRDADTQALRDIVRYAQQDTRVNATACTIGDGLLMCLKR
jgi:caffeoyl-CoA O-methyltransferase